MERNRVGADPVPDGYVEDNQTQGPVLPEGWDGDAWMKPGGGGYFVRAWNKATGQTTSARAGDYQTARQLLQERIRSGTVNTASVKTTEKK